MKPKSRSESRIVSQVMIARKLNLSQRTVSLCLTGSDRVADDTKRRVLEAASSMGYRPNRSALAMRSGRFNTVALIQSTSRHHSYLPGQLLVGLQESTYRRNLHLVLASAPEEKLSDGEYLPTVLREWSVDGFLINYTHGFSSELVSIIENSQVPTIWLNTKRQHNCVYPDDIGAGRVIAEQLLKLGHRRIAFLSHRRFEDHYSVADRFEGYAQAMRTAGLEPRKMFYPDNEWHDVEDGMEYIRMALKTADRPTAIVAYESFEAMRAILVAFKLGLDVPKDLSIATFHELEFLDSGFPVSTMKIPEAAMGQAAVAQLMRMVDEGVRRVPFQSLAYTGPLGHSIAPPPAD